MDGRKLSALLKAKGLTAIKKYGTIVYGYSTYSKGDYRIYTEKSFGEYGNRPYQKYIRQIECSDKAKPIIMQILADLKEPILQENANQITIPSW